MTCIWANVILNLQLKHYYGSFIELELTMYTLKDVIRDVVLFSLLAFLILHATDRLKSFLSLHKESLVHELDKSFADQLYAVQKQTRTILFALEKEPLLDSARDRIEKIQKNLEIIESKYTKNSPGVLFLGPIGTTSIVLKEQQLQQKLLDQTNEFSQILHEITQTLSIPHASIKKNSSIQSGIELNQALIAAIRQVIQKTHSLP